MSDYIAKVLDLLGAIGPGATVQAIVGRALHHPTFVVPLPGDHRKVELRFGTSDYEVFEKIILRHEYAFPPIAPPRVIVDGGAHVGLAAIFFALRYPEAKILAIELEPRNFDLLCRNVRAFPGIRPVHAALWPELTRTAVLDVGDGTWGYRVAVGGLDAAIPTVTVPSLLDEHGFERADILKLDIEGAEREVLAAAAPWIDRVGGIVAELHERFAPGAAARFQEATGGFDFQWTRGENVFVARRSLVPEPPPDAIPVAARPPRASAAPVSA